MILFGLRKKWCDLDGFHTKVYNGLCMILF